MGGVPRSARGVVRSYRNRLTSEIVGSAPRTNASASAASPIGPSVVMEIHARITTGSDTAAPHSSARRTSRSPADADRCCAFMCVCPAVGTPAGGVPCYHLKPPLGGGSQNAEFCERPRSSPRTAAICAAILSHSRHRPSGGSGGLMLKVGGPSSDVSFLYSYVYKDVSDPSGIGGG